MTKRIVTKIGDIFCAEIDNQYKRYFQYIVNDMEQLNSSVIRVFKKHYHIDYKPIIDNITKDEVEFYAHTILRFGILYNAWYKVGNTKEVGDSYKNVLFGTAQDVIIHSTKEMEWVDPMDNWYIWYINEPHVRIGKLTKEYQHVERGEVISYVDIVARLKLGYYTYKCPGY